MIRTAVILAAGCGTRFGDMTKDMPKGFVRFKGEEMVVRSIKNLLATGIERIIIGTGYHHEYYDSLKEIFPAVQTVFSERYADTNSMYTLFNCKDAIGNDDFLLLESDIVYQKKALEALLSCQSEDVMLITPERKFQDQYYIETDKDGRLSNCHVGKTDTSAAGELVGIHKISNGYYKRMISDYSKRLPSSDKMGYEFELLLRAKDGDPVSVMKMDDLEWYEIDDQADLDYAERKVLIN